MNKMVEELLQYAKDTYRTLPDFPWKDRQGGMVLRHGDNRKWYGLIFSAARRQLGIGESEERVDILNVKCDPVLSSSLRSRPGVLPAYHMNHVEWTTLLLDGTVPRDMIFRLLDMSYALTASKKEKALLRKDSGQDVAEHNQL